MAHSTIGSTGVGATQAGTSVTTTNSNKAVFLTNETDSAITLDLKIAGAILDADKGIHVPAKGFITYTHTGGHGACVMENVQTAHGTSAQKNERLYISHRV
jgi:hypothetical protein